MKTLLLMLLSVLMLTTLATADEPTVHRATLKNGVPVIYLHVQKTNGFSIFTLMPLGLASDDAGHAQWSHLVEHLEIRTTLPDDLTHANAETQADHMRLDYYGTSERWREALGHHERWIRGLPFNEKTLRLEVPRANGEVDVTAQRLVSGKFAFAAWNQIYRHGLAHAAVKQDLMDARLADVQAYRDAHLFVPEQTVVCAIGSVAPREVLAAMGESLGELKSAAKPLAAIRGLSPQDRAVTWDVSSRQLLFTWPICGSDAPHDYAALLAASMDLTAHAATDPDLAKLCGPFFSGVNLISPEGPHFFMSATLKRGASPKALRAKFDLCLKDLVERPERRSETAEIGHQSADQYKLSLLKAFRGQLTDVSQSTMIEAQFALMWATADFQLGAHRENVVNALGSLTADQIDRAVKKFLRPEQRTSLLLSPKDEPQK